ncbi:MAG: hypothetical protein JWM81_1027 [Candidatus Saccharibacteria bacterium]|nr:hypothetical protein [Candidatus Saccharibacteria bacterium]
MTTVLQSPELVHQSTAEQRERLTPRVGEYAVVEVTDIRLVKSEEPRVNGQKQKYKKHKIITAYCGLVIQTPETTPAFEAIRYASEAAPRVYERAPIYQLTDVRLDGTDTASEIARTADLILIPGASQEFKFTRIETPLDL